MVWGFTRKAYCGADNAPVDDTESIPAPTADSLHGHAGFLNFLHNDTARGSRLPVVL
jgi:hypothetical protein